MGVGDRTGHLFHEGDRDFRLGRERVQELCQRAARGVRHREVVLPFDFAHVVDRHDIRVRQMGRGAGLLLKARHFIGAGQDAAADHLQRHDAVQHRVERFVDHSHAARRDFAQKLVASEGPRQEARRQRGRLTRIGPGWVGGLVVRQWRQRVHVARGGESFRLDGGGGRGTVGFHGAPRKRRLLGPHHGADLYGVVAMPARYYRR